MKNTIRIRKNAYEFQCGYVGIITIMAYIFSWRDTLQRINFLLFGIIARKMIWQKKKNAKNADGTKFFAGIKYIQKIVFIILYTNIKMLLHSIDVFV